jgi:membrane protease YdiL (CAAX protease family)
MALYVILALLTALSAPAWIVVARRVSAGVPILPLCPRRLVPWNGLDLLLVAVVYVLTYVLAARAAAAILLPQASATAATERPETTASSRQTGPRELAVHLLSGTAANLATILFALLWMSHFKGAEAADFGWRRDTWRRDLCLGALAFAAVAAPVYGLQMCLSPFAEERHPIIEVLERQPSVALYVLAGFSAVAVAPWAEELFFRVLLQGWLESDQAHDAPPEAATLPDWRPRPLAIVITSFLFAGMHLGQGAAPVPLFFLALALGYLYQRTHRLLPCVTVHFCLNACSFALLFFSSDA